MNYLPKQNLQDVKLNRLPPNKQRLQLRPLHRNCVNSRRQTYQLRSDFFSLRNKKKIIDCNIWQGKHE